VYGHLNTDLYNQLTIAESVKILHRMKITAKLQSGDNWPFKPTRVINTLAAELSGVILLAYMEHLIKS